MAILGATLLAPMARSAVAATANAPEAWTGGTTAGWVAYDLVNEKVTTALGVESGALRLRYAAQSVPLPPDQHVIKADSGASGGRFVGNYLDAGVQAISFRFKPDMDAGVCLALHSDVSGRRWRYALSGLATGTWNDVTVKVNLAALALMNGKKDWSSLAADLQSVSWVGVVVERNPSMAEQFYRLDDFQLVGVGMDFAAHMRAAAGGGEWTQDMLATGDLDHDGSDNYSEFAAGTAADAASDALTVKVEPKGNAAGMQVSWKSKPGRVYRVLRSTSPHGGFAEISGDLTAAAEQSTYDDPAGGGGTFFYRVSVQSPSASSPQ